MGFLHWKKQLQGVHRVSELADIIESTLPAELCWNVPHNATVYIITEKVRKWNKFLCGTSRKHYTDSLCDMRTLWLIQGLCNYLEPYSETSHIRTPTKRPVKWPNYGGTYYVANFMSWLLQFKCVLESHVVVCSMESFMQLIKSTYLDTPPNCCILSIWMVELAIAFIPTVEEKSSLNSL